METLKKKPPAPCVIAGAKQFHPLDLSHLHSDPTDHMQSCQTLLCPPKDELDNIQLYSTAVQHAGEIVMTLHEFDPRTKNWGPSIGSSALQVLKGDTPHWMRFDLPPVYLRKDVTYGFRVQASNAMVALGEAATGTQQPFTFGHEWSGDSKNQRGHYYSYFSLAFKVEMCTN
jgi:hypothetical protein